MNATVLIMSQRAGYALADAVGKLGMYVILRPNMLQNMEMRGSDVSVLGVESMFDVNYFCRVPFFFSNHTFVCQKSVPSFFRHSTENYVPVSTSVCGQHLQQPKSVVHSFVTPFSFSVDQKTNNKKVLGQHCIT